MNEQQLRDRIEVLESTCRMLEGRIDGIVAALATTPIADQVQPEKAVALIKSGTGRSVVSGHGKHCQSKSDMEGQASMIVGQIKHGAG